MKTRLKGPFVLSIRDIVHRPGEMREHEIIVNLGERWGEGLVAVEAGTKVSVTVRLESVHEGILASGTIESVYRGECGRCLNPVEEPVEVEFQELFAYPGEEANDFEVQDDHVDLETLVRDAIVLSLPFQPVCQVDCTGLSPETGERLTEGTGVERAARIDPRWSVLQQITDQGRVGDHAPENIEGK